MNKRQFMSELNTLLAGISDSERNDAMQYYDDYFADANITDDMEIPDSLGNPKQVAETIIKEACPGPYDYSNPAAVGRPVTPGNTNSNNGNYANGNNTNNSYNYGNGSNNNSQANRSKTNNALIVTIVVAILTFPFWIGIVMGILGITFGLVVGLFASAVGFLIGGGAIIVFNFIHYATASVPSLVLMTGGGIGLIGCGLISIVLLIMFCGRFLPWITKLLFKLCKSIVGGKGEKNE